MTSAPDFVVNGWDCTYARFDSFDLAEIVGLSGAMQRLWRSRGFLPGEKLSRLRFTSRDVAEIMVRFDLSKLGVPPSESEVLGHFAAQTVLWFALLSSDGACEVCGSVGATGSFLQRFADDAAIANVLCDNPDADRFIVRSPVSDPVTVSDLADYLEEQEMRSGSFLDLARMSYDLTARAQRPLIRVKVDNGNIRRLTGQKIPHIRLV